MKFKHDKDCEILWKHYNEKDLALWGAIWLKFESMIWLAMKICIIKNRCAIRSLKCNHPSHATRYILVLLLNYAKLIYLLKLSASPIYFCHHMHTNN